MRTGYMALLQFALQHMSEADAEGLPGEEA